MYELNSATRQEFFEYPNFYLNELKKHETCLKKNGQEVHRLEAAIYQLELLAFTNKTESFEKLALEVPELLSKVSHKSGFSWFFLKLQFIDQNWVKKRERRALCQMINKIIEDKNVTLMSFRQKLVLNQGLCHIQNGKYKVALELIDTLQSEIISNKEKPGQEEFKLYIESSILRIYALLGLQKSSEAFKEGLRLKKMSTDFFYLKPLWFQAQILIGYLFLANDQMEPMDKHFGTLRKIISSINKKSTRGSYQFCIEYIYSLRVDPTKERNRYFEILKKMEVSLSQIINKASYQNYKLIFKLAKSKIEGDGLNHYKKLLKKQKETYGEHDLLFILISSVPPRKN